MKLDITYYQELAETNQPLDCGDNSCRFVSKRTGMRTNGGCRCMSSRQYALSHALDYIDKLQKALEWYEKRANVNSTPSPELIEIWQDRGAMARSALENK